MSLHKKPLTVAEAEGLKNHGLPIGMPSQLADSFRLGMAWAQSIDTRLTGLLDRKFTSGNDVPVTDIRLSRAEVEEELRKPLPEACQTVSPLSPGTLVITPRNLRSIYLGADGEALFSERMKAHCIGAFSVPFRAVCHHEDAEHPDECPWCDADGMREDSVKVPVETCMEVYRAMVRLAPQSPHDTHE